MGAMPQRATVRQESLADFLLRLGSRSPTPAGGVVAALSAAHAAGLLGMAARFTVSSRDDEAATLASQAVQTADRLRERSLDLAAEDESAVDAVGAAYDLPRGDAEETARRRSAIRGAVADAARPPAGVVAVARELLVLAERLLPAVNPTLLCDVAAAAEAIRAAASIGGLDVAANVRGLPRDDPRCRLLEDVADVDQLLQRAAALRESVRRKVDP